MKKLAILVALLVAPMLASAQNAFDSFEDEQDDNVILSPIVFEDGLLFVPKENQILQHFLSVHPENGKTFEEVNKEADAQGEIDTINLEADALIAARSMDISQMEIPRQHAPANPVQQN